MSNHTITPLPSNLVTGNWIWKTDRNGSSRKVTFIGFDGNYVDFVEGWVDLRAGDLSSFSLTNPEA